MTFKLSEDQREALDAEPGLPIKIEDEQTHRVYVVVSQEEFRRMADENLRRDLQIGFDQADRGQVLEWDPERIKAEGRQRLKQQSLPS